ncbi:GYDIA family GHMP kinase [Changchengzhania lutea]|uniref:GYDIA family GHMP kinase n=1 Tax=Changchengzhania lutea TaxID=2049305 RepID=UPI00115C7AD9|nr:GYDIA family GHMP kinase [Changchengzhania lutea]
METFKSNGKLLITGEYVVLDGALSLAIPTKYGQSLEVETINEPKLIWKSLDENSNIWFEGAFDWTNARMLSRVQHDDRSKRLVQIFNAAKSLNPNFIKSNGGFKVTTHLEFPTHWGLGTSSTLINNIAQWAQVDAYKLLEMTFGGSGYDIACAQHNTPITYQLDKNTPIISPVDFNPDFKAQLYFVYLNKKQNSRKGIAMYRENSAKHSQVISEISNITSNMIGCKTLAEFELLIIAHEHIISRITKQIPVKEILFKDFPGSIKSLGAWGGDFVLATAIHNPTDYFLNKGYETVIPYTTMIK